jgi:Ni,Fe-hydrogenase III component G
MEQFERHVEEFLSLFIVHRPVTRRYVTIELWEGIVRPLRANSKRATML